MSVAGLKFAEWEEDGGVGREKGKKEGEREGRREGERREGRGEGGRGRDARADSKTILAMFFCLLQS